MKGEERDGCFEDFNISKYFWSKVCSIEVVRKLYLV